ncbi:MAG: hypothetical protein QOI53_1342 [Verrucomicrobiota bacterium]|jgi:hypothetical protein|nr:hypothetical protein [Verrucomicrobiota bacterium]
MVAKGYPWGSLESGCRNSRLTTISFFRPACCCDVAYLSQTFSQPPAWAIMDKSGRQFDARYQFEDDRIKNQTMD